MRTMGIILYKHNLQAYQSLKLVLEQSGRACVVHPTGTGKSYIGFKLCEDYPDKKFCWLSPSEYIYRTQIENLNKDHGYEKGDDPFSNIHFCTYAKLSYLSKADLAAIAPDYIILDEFHRCGAEVWGTGVQRLLAMYPDAKLVGLSATAIRYLDNQRDIYNNF